MPCVQYHLRHLQFASSSTTPFQLVHAWAAATPMQRFLAPWALVPKELPCEDWVQELVATWRKITDRFAAYLQDYEAKAAGRRDSKHTWVTYRSRVISSCWSAIRWRGTLRESWASAWKVRAEAAFALRVPCGPRGDGWPGDGATPGGDTGVATSRLLRVPAGAWDPLRLDDVVVPVTEKPLSEADRRSYAQFPLGACVGWHEDGVYTVGQIRANFPRRLLFRLAVFRLNHDVWQRVYLDSRGSEVPTVTTQESLIEVPYSAVIGKVVLDDAGYADKPSERRMVALRLRPHVWEVSPGSALGEAPDVEAIAVGVEVRRSTAEWPTVPAIPVLGAEMTILPKGLTAEELA